MKKQTLNRRVRIAGALLLAALLLSAVVAPLALLASPSTGISGEGALSFASAEEPDVTPVPDHDQASLEEQSKILAGENRNDRGCGFDVKIPGYEYRDIGTTGKEEAMEAMRMEQKGGE